MTSARLTIRRSALRENYRRIARHVQPSACGATVKADAYGLGMALVARELAEEGCRTFFVASCEEGLRLRKVLGEAEIFVFEGALDGFAGRLADAGLTPCLNDPAQVDIWQRTARRRGRRLPAAIHVDTGMTRLGMTPAQARETLDALPPGADLEVTLLMTHLACADNAAHPLNALQVQRFAQLSRRFPGLRTSIGNSAGALGPKALHGDLVRPGIALYGANPFSDGRPNPVTCVARLCAPVLQVRTLDVPSSVGYGASVRVDAGTCLATVGIGYADGYPRRLSGVGQVVWNDRSFPILGRVSMDLIVVDIGDASVAVGDQVELFGPALSIDRVAEQAGTIAYELLTAVSARVPREAR